MPYLLKWRIKSGGADFSVIELAPSGAILLPNNSHEVTATVVDENGSPLEGIRVDFVTAGVHDEHGYGYTDVSGMTTFSYVGQSFGLDNIEASVGTILATATAEWVTADPHIVVSSPNSGDQFHAATHNAGCQPVWLSLSTARLAVLRQVASASVRWPS